MGIDGCGADDGGFGGEEGGRFGGGFVCGGFGIIVFLFFLWFWGVTGGEEGFGFLFGGHCCGGGLVRGRGLGIEAGLLVMMDVERAALVLTSR